MKLHFSFFSNVNILDESQLLTIVIEERKLYYKFLSYLYFDFPCDDDFIYFIDVEKDPSDICYFIENLFDLSLNTKKNLSFLYKSIKTSYFELLKEAIHVLNSANNELIERIKVEAEYDLYVSEDIKPEDYLKLINLRFTDTDKSLLERLIDFIVITSEIQKIKIFFISDIHRYFSAIEIEKLVNTIKYYEIYLINVESSSPKNKSNVEKICIYDVDFCTLE